MSAEEDVEIVVVDIKTVARGTRIRSLLNSVVVNDHEETIGTLDDLIIEREGSNQLSYAVLQVGGFLGIGGRLVAVEFESLRITKEDDALKITLPGASREALERLPAFVYGS